MKFLLLAVAIALASAAADASIPQRCYEYWAQLPQYKPTNPAGCNTTVPWACVFRLVPPWDPQNDCYATEAAARA